MYDNLFLSKSWKCAVDNAYNQAKLKLFCQTHSSRRTNSCLGPGWPGILLHEAIGHGLEGDFNRKKHLLFMI